MRDKGAFALGFLIIGNLWVIAGLHTCKEGVETLSYATGLMWLFLGVFGVYRAYHT